MTCGCGKYDETVLLRYVDGTLDDELKGEFEGHLAVCDACLAEVMEMQRIGAAMEAGEGVQIPLVRKLSLFVKNNLIERYIASFQVSVVSSAPSRGGAEQAVSGLKFGTGEGDVTAAICADKDGRFFVELDPKGWTGEIELVKMPDASPFYLVQSDGRAITMAGIPAGRYRLTAAGAVIEIEITGV